MVTRICENNILVKLPFDNYEIRESYENNDILLFFKDIFKKIISKYSISSSVNIDFYLDNEYGIILDIYFKDEICEDIDANIIFHLDCLFLIEVNYFDFIGSDRYLYYWDNKFYYEFDNECIYDGEIIYNSKEILDKALKLRV